MNALVLALLLSSQTYRLTGDALVLARAPAGVIAVGGDAKPTEWVSAEALIWAGSSPESQFDALVAALHFRHPEGWLALDAGRLIVSGGALRPTHLDGGKLIVRTPFGTQFEAFAGVPVGPQFLGRGGASLVGGRIAQTILSRAIVGLSMYTQSDELALSDREVGADFAFFPVPWLDVSGRASFDLIDAGLSEVVANAGVRFSKVRLDAYLSRRSPGRLLPATSIFSVLGDIPSTRAGTRAVIELAPRLDLSISGGIREVDGFGEEIALRATLRLDDRGRGVVAVEGRRDGTPEAGWYGARLIARVSVLQTLMVSTELELVIPGDSERGRFWPWGLIGVSWRPSQMWELAAALEASASPEFKAAIDALLRASYRWSQ